MFKVCEDLTGKRYGRLVVIRRADNYITPSGQKHSRWLCQCDCGNQKIIKSMYLKNGTTESCGCIHKEMMYSKMKKYNTYDLSGEYGIGYTSKGEEFYFDLEDYDKIKNYCWHLCGREDVTTKTKYLSSTIDNKKVFMHRVIMDMPNYNTNNLQIDHINHYKNDNRKANLRIVTGSDNQFNRPMPSNNTSGYVGVIYDKKKNIWCANIRINGKTKYLGSSKDKNVAIKLRQDAEKLYYKNEY